MKRELILAKKEESEIINKISESIENIVEGEIATYAITALITVSIQSCMLIKIPKAHALTLFSHQWEYLEMQQSESTQEI